jgi:formylglycine-generating enzyme required for sulfatase activity
MRRLLALASLLVALPAGAVNIEYVDVRDANNPPDTATNCLGAPPDCGSVPYDYAISKYEITNSEYVEFLNAVASGDDTYELFSSSMEVGFITSRTGNLYYAKAGFENKPVTFVSFWDAVRFANWLHNGQPVGPEDTTTTEDGAYTLTADGIANNTVTRKFGAGVFLPSENEWYKAAYYDPALPGFYHYPAGTDTQTTCAVPGAAPNTANCDSAVGPLTNHLTDVGAYTGSASPYGTFDQGGNVSEWNETPVYGYRLFLGGSYKDSASFLAKEEPKRLAIAARPDLGFRVARLVPEPAHALLVLTGGLVLAAAQRKRRA